MIDTPSGVVLYDKEDLKLLQERVDGAIARLINKQNSSRKYDLSYKMNILSYRKLVIYRDVLKKIQECNPCYEDYDVNKIVGIVQNLLGKNG